MKKLLGSVILLYFILSSCQSKNNIDFTIEAHNKKDEKRTLVFDYERIKFKKTDNLALKIIEKKIDVILENHFKKYQTAIDELERNPSHLYRDYYQADFRVMKVQAYDTLLFVIYDCIDVYFSLSKFSYWHERLCFSLNSGNLVEFNIEALMGLKPIDKEKLTNFAENIVKDSISNLCGFKRSKTNDKYMYVISLEPDENLIPIDKDFAFLYFSYLGIKNKQQCTQLEKWEENLAERPKFVFKVRRKDLESLKTERN